MIENKNLIEVLEDLKEHLMDNYEIINQWEEKYKLSPNLSNEIQMMLITLRYMWRKYDDIAVCLKRNIEKITYQNFFEKYITFTNFETIKK